MSIDSEVNDVDEVTKKIRVKIPADQVNQEFDQALNEVSKTVKLKGFRPGKAPRHLVEKMHGSRVRMEVANRLISSSLEELVKDLKIEMVGSPEIEVSSFEPGELLEYTASVSIFPSPNLADYSKLKVSVTARKVEDKDVDRVMEEMRDHHAELKKNEFRSSAKQGDVVDLSVAVGLEGEQAGRPEPVVTRLGDKLLPEEVEQACEGMEIGESKSLTVTLPDDHQVPKLRGQKAVYQFTLNLIYDKILPELNDEFAKKLGAGSLLESRLKVREQLEQATKEQTKSDVHAAIIKSLAEINKFLVPQVIIDDQIRSLLVRGGLVDPNKIDPNRISVESFRDKLGDVALERAKSTIILDKIAEIEKLQANEEEIEKALGEIAADNKVEVSEVKKYFRQGGRMVSLAMQLTRDKVLSFLEGRCEVTFSEESA